MQRDYQSEARIHIDALLKSAFPLSEISKKEIPDDVRQVSVGGEFAEALMSHRATGSEDEPDRI